MEITWQSNSEQLVMSWKEVGSTEESHNKGAEGGLGSLRRSHGQKVTTDILILVTTP